MTPHTRRILFDRYKAVQSKGLFRHWLEGLSEGYVHVKVDDTRIDMFFASSLTLAEIRRWHELYGG